MWQQVVIGGFNKHHVGIGKVHQHAAQGFQIDGCILTFGGVPAAAGIQTHDSLSDECTADRQDGLVQTRPLHCWPLQSCPLKPQNAKH